MMFIHHLVSLSRIVNGLQNASYWDDFCIKKNGVSLSLSTDPENHPVLLEQPVKLFSVVVII